ncbi:MAG: hypothetical protein LLG20_07305 [Acidobacteriales bacterium]|nr:hypothetical protein [Terriglobales bacterium]
MQSAAYLPETSLKANGVEQCHQLLPLHRARTKQPSSLTQHASALIATVHEWLMLMVPIAAVIWVPLQNDSLGGSLTVLDVILGLLWITTALLSGTRRYNRWQRVALLICILALIPELLGGTGAYLFNHTPIFVELRSLKRFGLPSIIPLATLLARPSRLLKFAPNK